MIPARECFDRKSIYFPYPQERLICDVCEANPYSVLVVTASYPYAAPTNTPAIIYTAHGGPESGTAMTDVLLGKYNPAGRTCQTWYKSERDLPSIKNYDIMASGSTYLYFEGETLFPFGHGLSYSTFEYSNFSVKQNGDEITATVKVKNTSAVYGEEVVQLYFTALNPRVKRPKKQLCEFIRQGIEPGKTVEIEFVFSKDRLRYWDVTRNKFAVETGKYKFAVSSSSEDVRATTELQIQGEVIPPRNMSKSTPAINYDNKREIHLRYCPSLEQHYVHAQAFNGSSAIEFYNVDFENISGIQVAASCDANEVKVDVWVKNKQVGEVIIPACACPTEFKKYKCKFKKVLKGTGTLALKFPQYVNLLDVKLIKLVK